MLLHVMRTTINIDDGIFAELLRTTGARTKTEAVRIALEEFVRLKTKEELLSLKGRVEIEDVREDLHAADRRRHEEMFSDG
jgi:Arc/MetJ family transcription regulator